MTVMQNFAKEAFTFEAWLRTSDWCNRGKLTSNSMSIEHCKIVIRRRDTVCNYSCAMPVKSCNNSLKVQKILSVQFPSTMWEQKVAFPVLIAPFFVMKQVFLPRRAAQDRHDILFNSSLPWTFVSRYYLCLCSVYVVLDR